MLTWPSTDTLKLRTSVTITETWGEGTNSAKRLASAWRSSWGVRPAAGTSFSSGSEIMPSGRTGTTRLKASLFQTETGAGHHGQTETLGSGSHGALTAR